MAKTGDETKADRIYAGTKQVGNKMLVKLTVGTDVVYHMQTVGDIDDKALDRKMAILKANKVPTLTAKPVKTDKSSLIVAEIAKATAKGKQ